MLKRYKIEIIIFYIIGATALIFASFFDLKLDILLNNPEQPFSIWFQGTGEIPCRLIAPFAGVIIYYLCDKPLLKAFGILCNLGGSAYFGYHLARYFFIDNRNKTLFGIIYGIGFALTIHYLGQFISVNEKIKKPLLILAFTGLTVMFVQLGAIEIIKMLWGRVRFRDLKAEPNYESFTAWYHPNGYNGNRSFPSGHTAGASMSYLMMTLPYISDKWKKRRIICFAIPFILTSTVAFTRLVMGAHYLSDVTMGGIIGFTTVIVAIKILDKKFFNSCNLQIHNV